MPVANVGRAALCAAYQPTCLDSLGGPSGVQCLIYQPFPRIAATGFPATRQIPRYFPASRQMPWYLPAFPQRPVLCYRPPFMRMILSPAQCTEAPRHTVMATSHDHGPFWFPTDRLPPVRCWGQPARLLACGIAQLNHSPITLSTDHGTHPPNTVVFAGLPSMPDPML